MKQTKQRMYEAPQVELIELEAQGVLCASERLGFDGTVMDLNRNIITDADWQ